VSNRFGDKIKDLRVANKWLQREIANQLSLDTPMLSKIERGDRKAKKEQIPLLAKIFHVAEAELMTLWLADQVIELIGYEENALKAMEVAEEEIKYIQKKTR